MKKKRSHQESGYRSEGCLEIISIRLYDPADRMKVMDVLERTARRSPAVRFLLFHNAAAEGDWAIHMWRPPVSREGSKSPEALCLFELLKEIGLVHHGVWLPADERLNAS